MFKGENAIDLTGQRFGRLTVLCRAPKRDGDQYARWVCKCDCGNTTEVLSRYLRQTKGCKIKSCGCYAKERYRENLNNWRKTCDSHTRSMMSLDAIRYRKDGLPTGVSKYNNRNKKYVTYAAYISFDKKRYHLIETRDRDLAISVRKMAEQHVKDGTFHKWFKMWKEG